MLSRASSLAFRRCPHNILASSTQLSVRYKGEKPMKPKKGQEQKKILSPEEKLARKQAKAKKKGGKDPAEEELQWVTPFLDTLIKSRTKILPYSDEEKAEFERIRTEYNRQTTIQNNKYKKDIATKMWLQQEAIKALPAEYREAAEVIDESKPPRDRPWPMFNTPPVEGAENIVDIDDEDDDDEEDEDTVRID